MAVRDLLLRRANVRTEAISGGFSPEDSPLPAGASGLWYHSHSWLCAFTTPTIPANPEAQAPLPATCWRMPRPAIGPQRCRIKSMTKRAVSDGAVHNVPADLRKVLASDPAA